MTYLYFLRKLGEHTGPVKIGITSSLVARQRSLNTGNCSDKQYVYYSVIEFPDRGSAYRTERMTHFLLASARVRQNGEWFDVNPQVAYFVARGVQAWMGAFPKQPELTLEAEAA